MSRAMRDLERDGIVGLRVIARSQLGEIPPVRWLVQGLITTGFSVLFGAPSAGKSLLALDWALHATTGTPWFKRPVEPRRCLYVAAEGVSGLKRRVDAWETDRHTSAEAFQIVPQTVNLLNRNAVEALDDAVGEHESKLLVIDTLSRSMTGGDENAAQDMGRVIDALSDIQRVHDCAILLIHHSGVEAKRPRGSTALFGACDTLVRVEKIADQVRVHCDKQKDDQAFSRWVLKLKPVADSVVFTPGGGAPLETLRTKALDIFDKKLSVTWTELVRASSSEAAQSLLADGSVVQINATNGAKYVRQGAQQSMQEAW